MHILSTELVETSERHHIRRTTAVDPLANRLRTEVNDPVRTICHTTREEQDGRGFQSLELGQGKGVGKAKYFLSEL